MTKVAATLVVVLMVLAAPVVSSATLVGEISASVTSRRGLLEANQERVIVFDMMHVHHVDSPYSQPDQTLWERAQDSAIRSKQRFGYLSSTTSGRRKLGSSKVYTSPLSPISGGDYIMQINIGTPSRTFLFFVNTGGDLVFMQCTPCTACFNQADPKFDPTKSSSYSPMPCTDPLCVDDLGLNVSCNSWASNTCEYNNTYGDQSFSGGNLAFETFTFPDTDGSTTSFPDVGFGCGTNQGRGNGNARGGRQPLDGVAGLGDGPLSLVSQLGPFIGNIFSYCLVSYGDSPNTTSPLLLGSAGDLPLAYTPLIKNTHYSALYYINLMGITVNNVAVDFPPDTFAINANTGAGGLVMETNYGLSQLSEAAYTPLRAAIAALVSFPNVTDPNVTIPNYDLCYNTSGVDAPVFPPVCLEFEGLSLPLPSLNVFRPVDNEAIVFCMSIANAGPNAVMNVLGNAQQQTFRIAIDRKHGRVGFAANVC